MRSALGVYADRRTWGDLLYALIGLPLGIISVVFMITFLSVGFGLAITLVGLPLIALTVVAGRGFGATYRGLAHSLLGVSVVAPPIDRPRGPISYVADRTGWRWVLGLGYLFEKTGWRAILFVFVQFPLAIIDFTVAVAFWLYGLAALTYVFWRPFLPVQHEHGVAHRGANLGSHYFLDTPPRVAAVTVFGLVMVLIAPWAVRGVLFFDRALIRGLLGPTAASLRIRALEDTRAIAVDDSAASLRRIERDLHDGAQARLVSLAMSLGLAKEELDGAEDSEVALSRVRELVDSAHREAKGTIVDLRDLARGIHPPALDNGLPDALQTLTARCAIPTTLHVDLPQRPSPAIETIVYFCTAELLTNAVKHSGALHASVDVRATSAALFVRVGDDGAGGAALARSGGSGLTGLADRVATVDGRLDIASPEGGPTLVTIEIPL
jgi:signal transduction histidine kinase